MERLGHSEKGWILRLREPAALHLAVENLAAKLDRRRVLLNAETLTDLVPRAASPDVGEPIPAWLGRGRRDDLDGLGVLELAGETRDPAVDARALAVQSDFGVDSESEVDRRRALGQLNHVARRREHEDLVLIEIELEEFQELVGSLGVQL